MLPYAAYKLGRPMIINTKAKIHHSSEEIAMITRKIIGINELMAIRRAGEIVLTKGVFDLLHKGHLHLFTYCGRLKRELPNGLLVVGILADKFVSSKGNSRRPINPEDERAAQVAAIDAVDYVIIYQELYPVSLIEQLSPKYYIKGQDTAMKREIISNDNQICISESDNNPEIGAVLSCGAQMVIYCDDGITSTTNLLKRIIDSRNSEGLPARTTNT